MSAATSSRQKRSAGVLMFRRRDSRLDFLLVHPGGPFWAKKDLGAWSIPKGEISDGEEPLAAAKREFLEETSFVAEGEFRPLGELKQPSGKRVLAWAVEGDCDLQQLKSNTFRLMWPPRSGRFIEVPEVDRAGWFSLEEARAKLLIGQQPFLDRLIALLN